MPASVAGKACNAEKFDQFVVKTSCTQFKPAVVRVSERHWNVNLPVSDLTIQ